MFDVITRILPWKDQYYLTQDNNQGHTGQNGVRFTGHTTRSRELNNQLTPAENQKTARALVACELQPGLLYRDPSGGGGQEGPDNLYANMYNDSKLGTGFSKRFLDRGRNHRATHFDEDFYRRHPDKERKWWHKPLYYLLLALSGFKGVRYTYNTEVDNGWNPSSILGRQFSLIAQAKWVAGEWMLHRFFLKIWFFGGIIFSALDANSQDGKFLAWFTIMSVEPKISWWTNPLIKLSFWYWRRKLRQQWGDGGMGAVLKKYWQDNGHPDIEHLWGDFGEMIK